jgi:hypothetical protein
MRDETAALAGWRSACSMCSVVKYTRLLNQQWLPGYHEVSFNAIDLPSGVYFYRMEAAAVTTPAGVPQAFHQLRKLLVVK